MLCNCKHPHLRQNRYLGTSGSSTPDSGVCLQPRPSHGLFWTCIGLGQTGLARRSVDDMTKVTRVSLDHDFELRTEALPEP